MRHATRLAVYFGVLLPCSACAQRAGEIPVTTSSGQALADFEKGQAALDVGRPQEAYALFVRAARQDSTFSYAYLNAANTAPSTEEFKQHLDLALRHLEGKSPGERLLVETARTFMENDAEKGIDLARRLVDQYPRSPRAWLTLATMQGTLNEHEAARESIARALEIDHDMFGAIAAMGFSYLFNDPKDFVRARQSMERLVELRPTEAKAYENLGDVYRALNELDRARDAYTKATELDQTLSVARLKKGHVNSFLGRYAEARTDYDAGVAGAKEGNIALYANYRAFVNLHAGDARGALTELSEIEDSIDELTIPESQVNGVKTFTLSNQATIALHYDLLHDADAIIERLAEVMRADAKRVDDATFTRSQQAAIKLWEGQLAAHRGDYVTAKNDAEESLRLLEQDNNPRRLEGYHALLGLVELLQQHYPAAVEHYKKANLTVMYQRYHLALAEEGAGNINAAKELFSQVAAWNFNSVGFALVREDAVRRAES